MIKKLEAFLFGKVFGRAVARLAVGAATGLATFLAGRGVNLDDKTTAEISAALITLANSGYTYLSDWRAKRAAAAATPKP